MSLIRSKAVYNNNREKPLQNPEYNIYELRKHEIRHEH